MDKNTLIEISDEVAQALQSQNVEVVHKWFIQPKTTKRKYVRKTVVSKVATPKKTTEVTPQGNARLIHITDKQQAVFRMRTRGNGYQKSKRNVALDLVEELVNNPPANPDSITLGWFREILAGKLRTAGHAVGKGTTIDLSYWLNTNRLIDIPKTRNSRRG